jgi:uncharacterized membrane protein YjjP (DUF1212 family)
LQNLLERLNRQLQMKECEVEVANNANVSVSN